MSLTDENYAPPADERDEWDGVEADYVATQPVKEDDLFNPEDPGPQEKPCGCPDKT